MDYRSVRKDANELFHRCQGVMLVFLLIFYCLKNYILLPLGSRLWSYVLSATSVHFITDKNVRLLLSSPQCIVAGLLVVAVFCAVSVWELSGIMLFLEYNRRGKPVKLLSLFSISLKNIRQLAQPKNWAFFVYIMLIMPFVNVYSSSGMMETFEIPEYIDGFIQASLPLKSILYALTVFLTYLCIRWFYVMQGMLLCRRDFSQSCKESAMLMKGRMIKQFLDYLRFMLCHLVTLCIVPLIAAGAAISLEMLLFRGHETFELCGRYAVLHLFSPLFRIYVDVLVRMAVSSYLVVDYHAAAEAAGLKIEAELPEEAVKTGKTYSFRMLKPIIICGIILYPSIACLLMVFTVESDPVNLEAFYTDVKVGAHKGYSSEAPENTLPAFKMALDCEKADFIELDVRESRDGIPVVIHNANVKYATGTDSPVYDLDYDVIRSMPALYGFDDDEFPDAYIPTLEETLQQYGGRIELLIEIKMSPDTPELPEKIVKLIEESGYKEMCMIHSGSYAALEKVKELDSSIPCGFIVAFGTGVYYDLPCADFFSVEHSFINDTMLERVHSLGKKVYAWTVNEDSAITELAAMDVDAVITDYPENVYDSYHSFDRLTEQLIADLLPQDVIPLNDIVPVDDMIPAGDMALTGGNDLRDGTELLEGAGLQDGTEPWDGTGLSEHEDY